MEWSIFAMAVIELFPDFLAEMPKDLFAEGDFRYARNDAEKNTDDISIRVPAEIR